MNYTLTFDNYQEGLEKGKFLGLKCNGCHTVTFPPMAVCRKCNGTALEVTELVGEGTLKTFTVIRVAPEGVDPPYVVAMAETDEGAWVMGILVGINPDETNMDLIGKRVKLGSQMIKGGRLSIGDARVITFTLQED